MTIGKQDGFAKLIDPVVPPLDIVCLILYNANRKYFLFRNHSGVSCDTAGHHAVYYTTRLGKIPISFMANT